MSPISAHSIWLVPNRSGATFARLRDVIDALARRSEGEPFDPHVTLIGSLAAEPTELLAPARSLAERLTPYEIVLGHIVARPLDPNRYRRLFAEVEPTEPVMAANVEARVAFGVEGGEAYAPHLSLAYADGTPAAFEDLKGEALRAGVAGVRFEARTLELWRTAGPVADWRLAGSFPILGTGSGTA
jgi:2'-5' RNA ligase